MKNMRRIWFRAGALAVLVAIAVAMMIIGRGHTVYLDNRSVDYNGQTYKPPYKVVVLVDGEQVAKLYDKERGMSTCIGQRFHMTLEITQKKGGDEVVSTHTLPLPYGLDGVAINLPAYLAGLPEEAYLSEFQIVLPEESAEEPEPLAPEDEFGLEGIGEI